jgi:hypothetical protein
VVQFILYTSMVIWFCVLFKQFRTEYFYLFLILALSDPVKLLLFYTLRISPAKVMPVVYLLILFTFIHKRYFYICLIICLSYLVLLIELVFKKDALMNISFALQILIAFILLYQILRNMSENKSINLFRIVLLTYLFINVLKYLAIALNYEQGVLSFYLGSFCQIAFGIAFIFINVNTKDFFLPNTSKENVA